MIEVNHLYIAKSVEAEEVACSWFVDWQTGDPFQLITVRLGSETGECGMEVVIDMFMHLCTRLMSQAA